jgi:hypothetical protein
VWDRWGTRPHNQADTFGEILNKKTIRFQLFDLSIILILGGSILSLFLLGRSHFLISVLLIVIGLWMILVLSGRFVAPLYLEGKMIRNLLANNGKLPIDIFEKHFKKDSLYEEHLNRLLKREAIEIVNKIVKLKNGHYKKGFQNLIMMWGTRKIKY